MVNMEAKTTKSETKENDNRQNLLVKRSESVNLRLNERLWNGHGNWVKIWQLLHYLHSSKILE